VFHEDLLFCKTIVGKTKAADLFNKLNSLIIENNIVWDRCFGVCTDGPRSVYYCNSRWLSLGNVLKRVFELQKELHCFLLEQKQHFEKFENQVFLIKLSYLCDI